MPNYRTIALLAALLAAPAALAADSPVPDAAPPAAETPAAAPAQTTPSITAPAAAAPAPAAPAPTVNTQPPGAAASAAVHPPHQAQIPPHRLACLTRSEQRAAVASHQAIPLSDAIKSLRMKGKRAEVVRARLCHSGDKLAYVLTLFGHSGKVSDVSVDAVSGDLIAGR